jgi:sugar phosphate permease
LRINKWVVAGASAFGMIVGGLPLVVFTFSVFLKPIVDEMGWSRAGAAGAISLFLYVLAFAAPLMGLVFDRFGVRAPLIVSILLSAGALATVSAVTSLMGFLAVFALAGVVAGGLTPIPYTKAVVGWFDRQRGLAIGIVNAGQGIGSAILPLVAGYFLSAFGWRGGYVGLSLLLLAVALPGAVFLVREHPSAAADAARRPEESRIRYRDILASRAFWIIVATTVSLASGVSGVLPHMVALLADRGYSVPAAAAIMSAVGLAGIVGRIATGLLVDLFFAPIITVIVFTLTACGLAGLWLGEAYAPSAIAAVVLGAGIGAESDLIGYLTSRYFAKAVYARVYGLAFFSLMIGQGAGAYAMGLWFDRVKSYDLMLAVFAALVLASGFLALRLGPYVHGPGEQEKTG